MSVHHVYKTEPDPKVDPVVEKLRLTLAEKLGVTVSGNRLTVRWRDRGFLRQVHMLILEVDDGEDDPDPVEP